MAGFVEVAAYPHIIVNSSHWYQVAFSDSSLCAVDMYPIQANYVLASAIAFKHKRADAGQFCGAGTRLRDCTE
jgi:hypothetical protein